MKNIVIGIVDVILLFLFGIFFGWLQQQGTYFANSGVFAIRILLPMVVVLFVNIVIDMLCLDSDFIPSAAAGTILILFALVYLVISMSGNPITKSKNYYQRVAKMVTVVEDKEGTIAFPNLLGENNDTSNLPLIGVPEAMRKVEAEMGQIPALGSQFQIKSVDMTSQSINGSLNYVIEFQPKSIWKWDENVGNNGYSIIDRNTGKTTLVQESLFTTPDAPFGSATKRIIRNYLKSVDVNGIITDVTPEVDDDGTFYYVATILNNPYTFGKFKEVIGVVTVNAVSLECQWYPIDGEIPAFIDRVYPESLFEEYITYYGKYKDGWWNSWVSQKGVLEPTDDMDVVYIDGVCYYYTGYTTANSSASTDGENNDDTKGSNSSNGIMMMNSRTGEITYYITHGISESRAMTIANGLVEDKGYKASYPLLLKVGGKETFFMLMRDSNNNFVGYSFVSYKEGKSAYGTDLKEAMSSYIKNINKSNSAQAFDESNAIEKKGVVAAIASEVVSGTTNYYIRLEGDNTIYSLTSEVNIDVVFAQVGDSVTIRYFDSNSTIEFVVGIDF